jgi:predicted AlkP superfamily phosphohydrolase/phosphomutase
MAKRIAVIGLDGATFSLLDPLMQKGYMPTLQKLCATGTRADLRSTMPPYTAPAWTTFATGVNPGKHGCYDFLLPTEDLERFDLCNSSHIQVPTLYELLHQAGKRSILINLPNSYPPKLATPTITDMLTVGENCVFPESLKERYPALRRYRLAPDEVLNLKGKTAEYGDDMIAVERDHMDAVKAMWQQEPWDLFYYLFSSTDWISHAMFNQLMDGTFPKAYELFKFIDDQLRWFVDHLPADTHLYVLSDHGFKVYQHTFYFNKWLEQEGYLKTKSAQATQFHQNISKQDEQRSALQAQKKFSFNVSSGMMQALGKVKFIERAARWFYHKVAKPFLPVRINLDVAIDFEKTTVCFPKGRTMTAIYINDGRKYKQGQTMSEAEYLKLRSEVKTKLEALRGPDGKPVTPKVYTKEEIYGEHTPERCPDLFYEFGDYWFVGQFHSNELFVDEVSSKHGPVGMFIAYGADIKAQQLPEQSIASVMPTLMHDLNQAVPDYVDGMVLPLFKTDRPVHYHSVNERQMIDHLIDGIEI